MFILIIFIGILTDFAFTPYNITPLIVVGFSTLFYLLVKSNTPKKAFTAGLLFGLGYFGFGNWWLFTIPDNAIAIVLFGVSVIMLMSLFYAVASNISVYLYSIKKIYFLIFTPIIFTISEKLRHSLWGGVLLVKS